MHMMPKYTYGLLYDNISSTLLLPIEEERKSNYLGTIATFLTGCLQPPYMVPIIEKNKDSHCRTCQIRGAQ